MNVLNIDSEPFEFEPELDEFADGHTGACSECGSVLELDEDTAQCSKCGSEFELDELEMDLDDLELEEEIKRGKSSFRRPSGRRSRPARRLSPRVKKSPRPKRRPLRPSGALRPKPKPQRHRPGKRPIIIRPRRRRPVVIREPAAPCVCPAHGKEFVRWVQSSLNQVLGLRLRVNGVMNRATRDAVRDFQKRESLPVDGIAGPETERALVDAKAGRAGQDATSTQSEYQKTKRTGNEDSFEDDHSDTEFEEEVEYEADDSPEFEKICPVCSSELVESEMGGFCHSCSREVAEMEFELVSDGLENELFEQELSSSALASAVDYNRNKAKSIGWYNHFDAIVASVLKLNYSPNEEAFAQQVADWQSRSGLDDDGKIGPGTWKKMKVVLGLKSSSGSKPSGKTGPLPIISSRMPDPVGNEYRLKEKSRNRGRQYGISQTIDALVWIAREWHKRHPGTLIGIGDISFKGGGEISPHGSHRLGLDVDLALFERATNKRISKTKVDKKYRPIVKAFLDLVVSNPILDIKTMFYFDYALRKDKIRNSVWSKDHWRHIHIRFCRPPELISSLNRKKVDTKAKYDCKGQSELYEDDMLSDEYFSDGFANEFLEQELSGSALASAVDYNRNKGKSIGWYNHFDAIVAGLLKLNYSPNERAFAQAVADWQDRSGLNDDGKLGPSTWKKMKVVLGISSGSSSIGSTSSSIMSGSRKEKITGTIEANRRAFGISKANERSAAKLWGNETLKTIRPSNINKYIGDLKGFGSHIKASQALFGKTSLARYKSGGDINFVMAIATREGGVRGLIRTDNTKVSSAGKDTHLPGVSGLDYLYKRAKYFREIGIFIEPVPKSALVPGRKDRAPAYIYAKHLMFAHMVEVARREYNTWQSDLVKVMKRTGVKGNSNDFFNDLSQHARRAWMALSYSGGGRVRAVFDFLIKDQKRRGLTPDFNEIMTNPFKGLKHRYKARVMLARATSLRAHVFDQFLV